MFAYECTLNNPTSTNSKHTKGWMYIFLNELHPSSIPFPVWVRTILIKLLAQNLIANKRTTVYVPDVQTYLRTYWFLPGHRRVTGSFNCTTTERSVVLKTRTAQSHLSLLVSGYQYWLVDQHCRELLWRNTNCTWSNNEQKHMDSWLNKCMKSMNHSWRVSPGELKTAVHISSFVGHIFVELGEGGWCRQVEGEPLIDRSRISGVLYYAQNSRLLGSILDLKTYCKSKLNRVFKHQINTINGDKPCQAV